MRHWKDYQAGPLWRYLCKYHGAQPDGNVFHVATKLNLLHVACRPYNSRIIAETTVPVICAYSPNNSPVVSYHGGNRFQGGLNLACPVDE